MHFNKITTTLLLSAAMLTLNACTDADSPENDMSRSLSITVSDSGFGDLSRAAEDGYRTEFSAGDACGLYIVRKGQIISENIRVEASVGEGDQISWTPAEQIYGGYGGESYFLYYPYQEDMAGKVDVSVGNATGFFAPLAASWEVKADQSDYADYTSSDLMTADGIITDVSAGNISLSFSMTHRMALAVIEMPKTVYRFTDNTDGSIPDCIVVSSANFTDSDTKPCRMVDGTYRCIMNPASATAPSIAGVFSDGSREFALTPRGIAAGSYKTYKVDNAATTEKQATLQPGDYFCKDRNNNWYIIPQEATPDANVIGIVFYVGQHDKDASDYTTTGIGQEKCHGYVVALTDVHNDENDWLRWEWGPNQEYDQVVGTSTNNGDWNGYSNSLKFHEFVNNNEGWEMKHFPAALACETYGYRTLDQDGNDANGKYDWQQPLAAPGNTSGWFLPSCAQLMYLYQNRSSLSARMADVQNSAPADCIYRDKIKWFMGSHYWSSTEYLPNRSAYNMSFYFGTTSYFYSKNYTNNVRSVLAF